MTPRCEHGCEVLLLGGCWVGEVRSVGQLRRVDPSAEALQLNTPYLYMSE